MANAGRLLDGPWTHGSVLNGPPLRASNRPPRVVERPGGQGFRREISAGVGSSGRRKRGGSLRGERSSTLPARRLIRVDDRPAVRAGTFVGAWRPRWRP